MRRVGTTLRRLKRFPTALPRVVTIGGGHGQAALLGALLRLSCDVTAVVSVADDGGCSGRLTEQFAMPPPGDIRRCLTTLACDRELAQRFEERLQIDEADDMRCAGNLAMLKAYIEEGSLQHAVDWAAAVLRCWGRVVPVAEKPGKLAVYDRREGVLEGETTVAERGNGVMVVAVHGVEQSNQAANEAIEQADVVLLGPGSFVTSTLAAMTTGQIAQSLVASTAKVVLLHNLVQEPGQLTQFQLDDYVRMLRDHMSIHSHGNNHSADDMPLTVLCHDHQQARERGELVVAEPLADGTQVVLAGLTKGASPAEQQHAAGPLAAALASLLELEPRIREPSPSQPGSGASPLVEELDELHSSDGRRAAFEQYLQGGIALAANKKPPAEPSFNGAQPQAALPSGLAQQKTRTP